MAGQVAEKRRVCRLRASPPDDELGRCLMMRWTWWG